MKKTYLISLMSFIIMTMMTLSTQAQIPCFHCCLSPMQVSLDSSSDTEICDGDTGVLTLDVDTCFPPYSVSWSGGGTTVGDDLEWTSAGTYTATVTDDKGCQETLSITTTVNPVPEVAGNSTDPSCTTNDGTIDVTPTAGTPGYTYLWSDGPTTQDRSSLGPGTYAITVTDTEGCTGTGSYTLTVPGGPSIAAAAIIEDENCNQSDGSVDVTVTPGNSSNLTYAWSNGDNTEDLTGIASGDYTLTVTDDNGCSAVRAFTVNDVPPPTVTISGDVAGCESETNLILDASAASGIPGYTYAWSGPQGNQTGQTYSWNGFSPAGTQTYTVTVTDAEGCTATSSVDVLSDELPDAELCLTSVEYCTECGSLAYANLNAATIGCGQSGGIWYAGDQTNQSVPSGSPVSNPSAVLLTETLTYFTYWLEGSGGCAGNYDKALFEVYYVIDITADYFDLEVIGDPCDCQSGDVMEVELIAEGSGNLVFCLPEWLAQDGEDGTQNFITWTVTNNGTGNNIAYDDDGERIEIECDDLPTSGIVDIEVNLQNENTNTTLGTCTDADETAQIDATSCCEDCTISFEWRDQNNPSETDVELYESGSFNKRIKADFELYVIEDCPSGVTESSTGEIVEVNLTLDICFDLEDHYDNQIDLEFINDGTISPPYSTFNTYDDFEDWLEDEYFPNSQYSGSDFCYTPSSAHSDGLTASTPGGWYTDSGQDANTSQSGNPYSYNTSCGTTLDLVYSQPNISVEIRQALDWGPPGSGASIINEGDSYDIQGTTININDFPVFAMSYSGDVTCCQ